MAHQIDFSNDRENMAYVGSTPWHGLGQQLQEGADIDQWRIAAGLGWSVKRSPVMYPAGQVLNFAEGRNVLYRDDTNAALGIVSDSYNIVQPGEVLEFYRSLVEAQGFILETAGSLRGGRRIWALARTGREFAIMGQDVMKAYLLLATSFDGSLATVASFTSVRVVCQNTLTFAVGADGKKADIRIPHHSAFNAEEVKQKMGLDTNWVRFEEESNVLAQRKVTKAEVTKYFMDLVYGADTQEMTEADLTSGKRKMQALLTVYEGGVGQATRSAQGTAWGLVNAVTRYVDHERQTRSTDNRLNSAWFGPGASMKSDAYQAALALAA